MPKIYEYLGIVILFYSNEHEPVHVHGKYQGRESKVDLIVSDGEVVELRPRRVKGKAPLRAQELNDFVKFCESFKRDILQKWIDYFVLHKKVKCIKIEGRVS
jgi:hypothetical protein